MMYLEAEKKEIKRLWKEAIDAENCKDLESIQRIHDDDVIWQRPNQPEIRGKKALLEVYKRVLEIENYSNRGEVKDIEFSESGDIAYGILHGALEGDIEFKWKALFVTRKIEGEWKVAAFCWNTNEPLKQQF